MICALLDSDFGTGIIGVLGVLLGVVVERLLRLSSRVRFGVAERRINLVGVVDAEGYPRNPPLEEADEEASADGVEYRFAIDLFNGRETPTGLRDARIELVAQRGDPIVSHPDDLSTGRPSQTQVMHLRGLPPRTIYDALAVVNLPPKQFTRLEVHGRFDGRELADAVRDRRWERIDFVAEFPSRPIFGLVGRKTYRKTITDPTDWRRP